MADDLKAEIVVRAAVVRAAVGAHSDKLRAAGSGRRRATEAGHEEGPGLLEDGSETTTELATSKRTNQSIFHPSVSVESSKLWSVP